MYDIPSDVIENIKSVVNNSDYFKGFYYPQSYINEKRIIKKNDYKIYEFYVESERTTKEYQVLLKINIAGKIIGRSCDCPQYDMTKSCKHIAACLIHNYNDILIDNSPEKEFNITEKIFKDFNFTNNIRSEINLELTIKKFGKYFYLYIKIGEDKLYSVTTKFNKFSELYNNESDILPLGKSFTYDPLKQYFNNTDTKILDFICNNLRYNQNGIGLSSSDMKILFNLTKNKGFYYEDVFINNIVDKFPIDFNLSLNDGVYELMIDDNYTKLTNDYEYIFYNDKIYHLNKNEAKLLKSLNENNISKLVFKKDKMNSFSKSILPIVKNTMIIDEDIKDIDIVSKPSVKLYFDIYLNKIICNIKLGYKDVIIDYFDQSDILRDAYFEQTVVNELLSCQFKNVDNKFIIDDINDIGDFLEVYLHNLSDKYEIYTSSKLKEINVIKNTNITSTFSIGKDNILKYDFDLGNITDNEVNKILSSIKEKKKYYRLKSGDIISLVDNENLNEFIKLREQLDINDLNGTIPKYKALYLDSLNYNLINKDNSFNTFIDNFNKYKDSLITINTDILRDYQINGVKWLYNIDKLGFGGILADEMGLGKSIQVIYYIKQLLKENKDYKFLIVVPTSLVYNWENEINKFSKDISYTIINGNKHQRCELIKNNTTIYITSYGLLREDIEYYNNYHFKSVIIDEAQNIKNPQAIITKAIKKINASTKIALTGTPLENSIIELWSIFDFIMPGFLSSLTSFQKKYKINDIDDSNELLIGLHKTISPFIMRRKKEDVILELPKKLENNIFIELNDIQKEIYKNEVIKVNKEIEQELKDKGLKKSRFKILQLLTRLRQIAIEPSIIFDDYKGGSSKIDSLIEVIEESISNNHKILVFTSFKTALNTVKEKLDKKNITSYIIDGSVSSKKRMELVDSFNNDNTNVFLIMLKSGGTGLNLTSADVVIHLDLWWNPAVENQATDRAHRIGQKNVVSVIKLITKGTIEEKILELQEKKKILSDKLIDSGDMDSNILSSLTEKDIRNLLSYENKGE